MRKNGSTSEFTHARDAALLHAFKRAMHESPASTIAELSVYVAMLPCPRFWVTEERATIVISALLRGEDSVQRMLPSKRRMYTEIRRRVEQLLIARPRASLYQLVSEVVNSPAPEFYLSPRYISDRLTEIRNLPTQRKRL